MTVWEETFTDKELLYAATAECAACGAGMAYPLDPEKAWELRALGLLRFVEEDGHRGSARFPLLRFLEGEGGKLNQQPFRTNHQTSRNGLSDGGKSEVPEMPP